ncbi:MAG: pyridoxal 5'-phosphate synthase subunit PdxT [Planctomycetota bacterium]|nr:MAG: pyridoxal 5'-phosphate synthase subunit PdxT [Planctomycetota bacterium]
MTATVGVLALQGDHEAHARSVRALGFAARAVKAPEHLEGVSALLLPGGESSTMLKLIEAEGLREPLRAFCASGQPVLGTCAGAILLARDVSSPAQASLDALDIDVERNAYGRQLESFVTRIDDGEPGFEDLEAVFIRAPAIRRVGESVSVLARHDGQPVLVRAGNVWAATFHPELSSDPRLVRSVLAPLTP